MRTAYLLAAMTLLLILGVGESLQAQPAFLLAWGSSGSAAGDLEDPRDVAVDSGGNVYVADTFNDRIQKFDANGNFLLQWGTWGSGDGEFSSPVALAIDSADNIYVIDQNERIQKFDTSGNFQARWGSFQVSSGIAVDGGNVYVVDAGISMVEKWTSTGSFVTTFGGFGTGDGQFFVPQDVEVGPSGNVYVTDAGNERIQVFDPDGNFLFKFGTEGAGDGQFNDPRGIGIDPAGNVYVGDNTLARVQKFDANGNFLLGWGSSGSGDGQFNFMAGIAADGAGNVYVADQFNDRVQKFGESTVAAESPSRTDLRLSAWPNPFNPQTTLSFDIDTTRHVRLSIHDAQGRLVATLLDGIQAPGRHEVRWNGRDGRGRSLASGVYRYSVEAGASADTRSVILVK